MWNSGSGLCQSHALRISSLCHPNVHCTPETVAWTRGSRQNIGGLQGKQANSHIAQAHVCFYSCLLKHPIRSEQAKTTPFVSEITYFQDGGNSTVTQEYPVPGLEIRQSERSQAKSEVDPEELQVLPFLFLRRRRLSRVSRLANSEPDRCALLPLGVAASQSPAAGEQEKNVHLYVLTSNLNIVSQKCNNNHLIR